MVQRRLRHKISSYELLKKYFEEAISVGFVQFEDDLYKVTEKERVILEKYYQFSAKTCKLEKI